MEIWQTGGYILEFACNAILDGKKNYEGRGEWMNF